MIHLRDPFSYFCDPFCPKFRAPKCVIIIMGQGEATNDKKQLSKMAVKGLEEDQPQALFALRKQPGTV